jgi:hypothetical protein
MDMDMRLNTGTNRVFSIRTFGNGTVGYIVVEDFPKSIVPQQN